MAEHVVIEHTHDASTGVYRLIVGVPANDEASTFTDVQDFVFADDDDRWFTGSGDSRRRRDAARIAADQRGDVLEALAVQQPAAQSDSASAPQLPGVGAPLTQ